MEGGAVPGREGPRGERSQGGSLAASGQPAVRFLSDEAFSLIRDMIVSLRLKPGAPLSERWLMQELGLGRTPIREALRRLADQNLVKVYPRRGIFVSNVDIRDLRSISEVRTELEGAAARLAAERATPEERQAATALIEELDASRGETDERQLIRFDQQIHRYTHRWSHNGFLAATLDEYFALSLRLWWLVLDRVTRLDEAVQEHRELLEAIRDGQAERAEKVVRRHVTGFEQEIRRALWEPGPL
ncbi:GntR family transcriptional regulator [soil metagenome]